MNSDFFNSMLSELANIISGRFSVHINDIFGNMSDIGVPKNNKFFIGTECEDNICEKKAYSYRCRCSFYGRDVSVLLYVFPEFIKDYIDDVNEFLDEIKCDVNFLFNDIVNIFVDQCENSKFYSCDNKVDFFNTVFFNEVKSGLGEQDNCSYICNNIFRLNDKKDIGGVLVFYS